jgi:hypothetical protein
MWEAENVGPNVPNDHIAALGDDDHPLAGQSTYDGMHMSSRGDYIARTLKKPASISTIEAKGGHFGITKANEVGCWFGDKPHRLSEDEWGGSWTWNKAERLYLTAAFFNELQEEV